LTALDTNLTQFKLKEDDIENAMEGHVFAKGETASLYKRKCPHQIIRKA
jgi:hypothetical protein